MQMGRLRLEQLENLLQGHRMSKVHGWDLNLALGQWAYAVSLLAWQTP